MKEIRSGMSVQDLKLLTAQREYGLMVQQWINQAATQRPTSPTSYEPRYPVPPGSSSPKSRTDSFTSDYSDYTMEKTYMTNSGQLVFFMEGVVNAPQTQDYIY